MSRPADESNGTAPPIVVAGRKIVVNFYHVGHCPENRRLANGLNQRCAVRQIQPVSGLSDATVMGRLERHR